jgi:exo-beta-1,3-glucanase (GH17 family)
MLEVVADQKACAPQVRCGIFLFCVGSAILTSAFAAGQTVPPINGMNFSPYLPGQDPNVNPQVSASQIGTRLQIIAPYTTWVRSFSVTTGLENIPPLAHSLKLKVAAGAWVSTNLTQNSAEISNLIAAAQAGNVDMAIRRQRSTAPRRYL